MRKVTILDVAKHAGVSTATVSHVINGTRFVSQETRERVKKSIQTLGYSPNEVARSLKTGRKNLIGCVVPDIANSFFSTIIEEAETVLGQRGYKLIVVNTKESQEREREHLFSLTSGIVDGLLIATTFEKAEQLSGLIPSGLPTVLIDRRLGSGQWDVVTLQDRAALYKGIETLLDENHRKIGYITGVMNLSTTTERLQTYRDVMKARGLEVNEDFIRYGDSVSEVAVEHAKYLLSKGCTALVVSNNVMAVHVMNYISGTIGGQNAIALLGYGDMNKDAFRRQMMHMIGQPAEKLGVEAGKRLLYRLSHPGSPTENLCFNSTFLKKQAYFHGAESITSV